MSVDIEIKPGHQSFCVWYVYVDGEPLGEGYGSYTRAEDEALRLEDELDREETFAQAQDRERNQ